MKQETLMKNINELLEIMPWYVKEYYQAKLVIPYSYKTLYEYLKEYRRFFEWLISDHEELGKTVRYADYDTIADVHIDELAHLPKSVIEGYFVYLRENTERRSISEVSIIRTKDALSSLFKYLTQETEDDEGEPYFYRNVWNKVKLKTHAETTTYRNHKLQEMLFVDGEDARFLQWLDRQYAQQLPSKPRAYFEATKERNLAIIALLFGSGVRVSELVNMNLEDLNMDRHTVQVVRKGNFQDRVNFADWIDPYLTAYLKSQTAMIGHQKPTSPLFVTQIGQTVNRIRQNTIEAFFKRYTTAYGRPSTPHKARHTLGTNIYTVTKDVQQVADQLGQTTTSATDLYINLSDKSGKAALREVSETAAKAVDQHPQQP